MERKEERESNVKGTSSLRKDNLELKAEEDSLSHEKLLICIIRQLQSIQESCNGIADPYKSVAA